MKSIALPYTLGLIYLCFTGTHGITRYITHVQNYVNLLSSYYTAGYSTVDMPPISNVSETMKVNVDVSLFAINGFDEVAGNIELVAALNMSWIDQMPLITSVSFNIQDRDSFLVPYEMIWTPKLVLTNAVGDSSEVGDAAYMCRFNMRTNEVIWRPRVIISGACTPDVTYYPFDRQTCSFSYTPWGFTAQELKLETSRNEWDRSSYQESGEWEIETTNTEVFNDNNQSYLKLTISIIRKPLYFAFNIVIPILVLCLLNGTVFLLPAESGERVGFSVTCFLSFVVLLNMIMDILPRSSNPISFLCYYLVVMMCTSGAMTLVTILLMRVYHKPEKSKVPKWMQWSVTFINCGCARLICCVRTWRILSKKCKSLYSKPLCSKLKINAQVGKCPHEDSAEGTLENNMKNDTKLTQNDGCIIVCKRESINDDEICLSEEHLVSTRPTLTNNETSSKSQKSVKQVSTGYSTNQRRVSCQDEFNNQNINRTASQKNMEDVEKCSISSDTDSLADLEEEVTWAEVGRIYDTFFFLVFTGGQIFFTIVFLVPLFTNTNTPDAN